MRYSILQWQQFRIKLNATLVFGRRNTEDTDSVEVVQVLRGRTRNCGKGRRRQFFLRCVFRPGGAGQTPAATRQGLLLQLRHREILQRRHQHGTGAQFVGEPSDSAAAHAETQLPDSQESYGGVAEGNHRRRSGQVGGGTAGRGHRQGAGPESASRGVAGGAAAAARGAGRRRGPQRAGAGPAAAVQRPRARRRRAAQAAGAPAVRPPPAATVFEPLSGELDSRAPHLEKPLARYV